MKENKWRVDISLLAGYKLQQIYLTFKACFLKGKSDPDETGDAPLSDTLETGGDHVTGDRGQEVSSEKLGVRSWWQRLNEGPL